MALRNILKDGDPGLLKKSREVKDFNKRLHILLNDMRETLLSANGLGIAAPQVGVLRRVALIVDLPEIPELETDIDNDEDIELPDYGSSGQEGQPDVDDSIEAEEEGINYADYIVELINPVIISEEGEQTGSEGCLSFPGRFGMVKRPQTVRIRAKDRYGKEFDLEASNMTARAICHEINHLDGVLFTSLAERMLTNEELEELRGKR